jgi:hypothetical protein
MALFLGDFKLTPGKTVITLLVIPALLSMIAAVVKHKRRFMTSDFFALAASIWMVVAPGLVSGPDVVGGAIPQALEVFGSYFIARALFFEEASIQELYRALKIVAICVIALGILDMLTQHFVAIEFVENVLQPYHPPTEAPPISANDPHYHRMVLGFDSVRATSTFDHPILFGTFCSIMAAILLYSEESSGSRHFYVSLCVVGCLVALSSAPLLGLGIIIATYCYDYFFKRYSGRWRLLMYVSLGGLGAVFVFSNNPIGWLIRNLTLDPQTGYWRIMIWDLGLGVVSAHPFIGLYKAGTGNEILQNSVDTLWLFKAMIYGLPMVIFLILSGAFAVVPVRGQSRVRAKNSRLDRTCAAYSLTIVMLAIIGFTATYWNAVWMFGIFCIGVRVSLKEYCLSVASQSVDLRQAISPRISTRRLGYLSGS